jgi:hypothetical protein
MLPQSGQCWCCIATDDAGHCVVLRVAQFSCVLMSSVSVCVCGGGIFHGISTS